MIFFAEFNKLILKFIWKYKELTVAKIIKKEPNWKSKTFRFQDLF